MSFPRDHSVTAAVYGQVERTHDALAEGGLLHPTGHHRPPVDSLALRFPRRTPRARHRRCPRRSTTRTPPTAPVSGSATARLVPGRQKGARDAESPHDNCMTSRASSELWIDPATTRQLRWGGPLAFIHSVHLEDVWPPDGIALTIGAAFAPHHGRQAGGIGGDLQSCRLWVEVVDSVVFLDNAARNSAENHGLGGAASGDVGGHYAVIPTVIRCVDLALLRPRRRCRCRQGARPCALDQCGSFPRSASIPAPMRAGAPEWTSRGTVCHQRRGTGHDQQDRKKAHESRARAPDTRGQSRRQAGPLKPPSLSDCGGVHGDGSRTVVQRMPMLPTTRPPRLSVPVSPTNRLHPCVHSSNSAGARAWRRHGRARGARQRADPALVERFGSRTAPARGGATAGRKHVSNR